MNHPRLLVHSPCLISDAELWYFVSELFGVSERSFCLAIPAMAVTVSERADMS